MEKEKESKYEYMLLTHSLFYSVIFFHLFILKESKGTIYLVATLLLFWCVKAAKKTAATYFKASLLIVVLTPIFLFMNLEKTAEVSMDYVFMFTLFGSIIEYCTLLKERLIHKNHIFKK